MALRDEIREEQRKVKDLPLSERIDYYWDYYKIPALIALAIIILAVIFIRDWVKNSRPAYLNAVLMNTVLTYDTDHDITQDYIDYAKVDTDTYNVSIDTSLQMSLERNDQLTMAAEQKLMAQFSTGTIDVIVAPEAIIEYYAGQGAFMPLTDVFTDAEIKKIEEAGYPVCYVTMNDETFPAGFYVYDSDYLKTLSSNGTFLKEDAPVFSIASCMQHPEAVKQFLQMIM